MITQRDAENLTKIFSTALGNFAEIQLYLVLDITKLQFSIRVLYLCINLCPGISFLVY
jgi:hypothetical protein